MGRSRKFRGASLPGQITVFLSLTILTVISVILVYLESARTESLRAAAMMETQLAMNALFSKYDADLYRRYDVFFIDGSAGDSSFSEEKVGAELLAYLDGQTGLKCQGLACTGRIMAAQDGGGPFYEQAVEYMQGKSIRDLLSLGTLTDGQSTVASLPDELSVANTISDQIENAKREALDRERARYEKEKSEAAAAKRQVIGGPDMKAATLKNPISTLRELLSTDVLDLAEKTGEISGVSLSSADILSKRECQSGIGDLGIDFSTSVWKDYMFLGYIREKLPSFTDPKDSVQGMMRYQCEYIFAGGSSDRENLKNVLNKLLLIRFALNMATIAAAPSIAVRTESMALAMTTAVGLPELSPVMKTALELLLAYEESLVDIHSLVTGGHVPLIKGETQIECDPEMVFSFSTEKTRSGSEGLDYSAYLQILLMTRNSRTRVLRCMDMVESSMRVYTGREQYRLSDGIGGWRTEVNYEKNGLFFRRNSGASVYSVTGTYTYYP